MLWINLQLSVLLFQHKQINPQHTLFELSIFFCFCFGAQCLAVFFSHCTHKAYVLIKTISLHLFWIAFITTGAIKNPSSINMSLISRAEYHFLSFEASEGGAEHILLSNKGRNLFASVCICIMLLRTGCAVLNFGAIWTRDMFRMNTLLINYRTARAGSGATHTGRTYLLWERTLH